MEMVITGLTVTDVQRRCICIEMFEVTLWANTNQICQFENKFNLNFLVRYEGICYISYQISDVLDFVSVR